MPEHCFRKNNSNPPVCGVHNVPLFNRQTSEVMDILSPKPFTFSVCPVSGIVVRDDVTSPSGDWQQTLENEQGSAKSPFANS
jgi:hypothetical protein